MRPAILKQLGLTGNVQATANLEIALHVSAGKTTPDDAKPLYSNNLIGKALATQNGWDIMTNAAGKQLMTVNATTTADLWARNIALGPKSSGTIRLDGDVLFLEGATKADLVKMTVGFIAGPVPGLEGVYLNRPAMDFGPIQDNLVKLFTGTPAASFSISAIWNQGGIVTVKIPEDGK